MRWGGGCCQTHAIDRAEREREGGRDRIGQDDGKKEKNKCLLGGWGGVADTHVLL